MKWTNKEIKILKENLHLTNKELSLLLNKSIHSVKYQCSKLGLLKTSKFCKYTKEDIAKLNTNDEFKSRITGHLLGDGTLNSDISFTLNNTKKDYVEHLQLFFNSLTGRNNKLSVTSSYITTINGVSTNCQESYSCTFTCSEIFRPLKKIWYQDKKIVPRSIKLNPIICNRWYCDDGSLYIDNKRGISRIILYTDAFKLSDVEFLIQLLNQSIDIHPLCKTRNNRKNQYVIVITGKDVLNFLNYIGSPPVDSFKYKWDTKNYRLHLSKCQYCCKFFQYGAFKSYRKTCDNCINKMHR